VGLNFTTSALPLLAEVLRAGSQGGRIQDVSLVFRSRRAGQSGTRESIADYAGAMVTSMTEQLSGSPSGEISLRLPATGALTAASSSGQRIAEVGSESSAEATRTYVRLGRGRQAYPVTGVTVSQGITGGPLSLAFTTSAQSLLERLYEANSSGATVRLLRFTARGGGPSLGPLRQDFKRMAVTAFAENLSGQLSGEATLMSKG
jgi:hypothetical protein